MKLIRGIYLPDGDTHFEPHLMKGPEVEGRGTYQKGKCDNALSYISGDRRYALDIGAHVGLWTRQLAPHFDRVIAFEPVPEHIACWERNTEDLHNVDLQEVALGEKQGVISMNPAPDNSGNACVQPGSSVLVNMWPLDRLISAGRAIDFIKIDVEGYELFVIKGGEATIRESQPVMVVEQKTGNAERYGQSQFAAIELLKSWGAQVMNVKSGDYVLKWP